MHVSCARETAHEELTTLSQHRYLRLTDMILIAGEKGERSIVVVADVVVDGRPLGAASVVDGRVGDDAHDENVCTS